MVRPLHALTNWYHKRIIRRSRVSRAAWQEAFDHLPLLSRLQPNERRKLIELAALLLHQKQFIGAQGLEVNSSIQSIIALQACLPVLYLGLSWYRPWHTIIVYPASFKAIHSYMDESGVMHEGSRVLSGEAWLRGPVILSWQDVAVAGRIDGDNLVIHEFAHKLDMLNGKANGLPTLHKEMDTACWTEVFATAYADFQQYFGDADRAAINNYAATSPSEFFAVLSETFFELPQLVYKIYPEVYRQMSLFYRQDPLRRMS